jgi:hypothetical protein
MTPRERFLAALRGEPVDRVPLHLIGFRHIARSDVEELQDPRRKEIARRVYDHTHCVLRAGPHVNRLLVTPERFIREVERKQTPDGEIVTCRIETPKGELTWLTGRNNTSDTTWAVKYPVESRADIEKIRSVPWVRPEWTPPDMVGVPSDFGKRGIVGANISSPFVCVAGMMPYQMFLELCATDLDLVKQLTDICRERVSDLLDMALKRGFAELVWMGGSEWLTPPMASPRLYAELVHPYEASLIEQIHAAAALCHLHCHGNVASTVESVIDRGADYFEPVEPPPDGDITMAAAKRIANGRITLGGNIESRIIEYGSVEDVETAVRAAFEGGKDRMVLQTTEGPIGRVTPKTLSNYHRMIDVWEELSPI